ncbi:hypothetical protein NPIL_679821 [Nephila pilipes]|uniref:Uncharacterized protein n=1 Tax=Nephila pilipes TaxID=299642 RepID=A0A8X6Q0N6_NEPPI|nr:hypothetical protein NPIL_679821 [Nephila pilipes]
MSEHVRNRPDTVFSSRERGGNRSPRWVEGGAAPARREVGATSPRGAVWQWGQAVRKKPIARTQKEPPFGLEFSPKQKRRIRALLLPVFDKSAFQIVSGGIIKRDTSGFSGGSIDVSKRALRRIDAVFVSKRSGGERFSCRGVKLRLHNAKLEKRNNNNAPGLARSGNIPALPNRNVPLDFREKRRFSRSESCLEMEKPFRVFSRKKGSIEANMHGENQSPAVGRRLRSLCGEGLQDCHPALARGQARCRCA